MSISGKRPNILMFMVDEERELLGAHGGMHQKWHNAYEEATHVPLIISNPLMFKEPKSANMLTSHVDLIPTLLGLAGIDYEETRKAIRRDHTEVRKLVGRDLSDVVTGKADPNRSTEPLYFMTDDEISSGLNQTNKVTGKPYTSVVQPNHIESVFAVLRTGEGGSEELWKYSRYFDNPQFWTKPFQQDVVVDNGKVVKRTKPVPAEFEMYNVTEDNLERVNLAHKSNGGRDTEKIREKLEEMLRQQRDQKRLYPEPMKHYAQAIVSSD